MRFLNNCYYCAIPLTIKNRSTDHLKPKVQGGSSHHRNLVSCCNVCNSTKGGLTVQEARHRLVQRVLGWPKFNPAQLAWLREQGFDMSKYDDTKLAFERVK